VGKETIFGLLKALELFVNQDYEAVLASYDARAKVISDAIAKFGVTPLPREFDPNALGNVTPKYSWHIDTSKLKITATEVMQKLADTRPIGIGSMGAGASGMRGRMPPPPPGQTPPAEEHHPRHPRDESSFGFAVWQLKVGEDKVIADRLVEIFKEAQKA
jgi:L-seryl-tRNA(Ser) seleniumtransferase